MPFVVESGEPVWHLYVIRSAVRDALQACLTASGINTLIHYPVPPHLSGAYADQRTRFDNLPIAERLAQSVLSLPIGPHLAPGHSQAVVQAIIANKAVLSS